MSDPSVAAVGAPAYIGLFLLALATLMDEILLTRVFSVTMWYHFAFMAISVAMFGLTAGGLLVYLWPEAFPAARLWPRVGWCTLLFAILVVGCFLTQLCIPFFFEISVLGLFTLGLIYFVVALPFVASGTVVALVLTRFPARVGRLYAADLVGAASGCLLLHLFLELSDGPTTAFLVAALGALAAIAFGVEGRDRRLQVTGLLVFISLSGFAGWSMVRLAEQAPLIPLRYVKDIIETSSVYEKWNSYSRVRVFGDATRWIKPSGWGFSPIFPPNVRVRQLNINIDGSAGTVMTAFDGATDQLAFLKYDIVNLAHWLRPQADVMVIGIGGGRDLLSALAFSQRSVLGVEINQAIIDIVTYIFGEFTSHLDRHPSIRMVNDEARSFIARHEERFDIIQASLIDTWAATVAGAFALSENGLYTLEAWDLFFRRLKPGGILTFSRWYVHQRPYEMYRLVALAAGALRRLGVARLRDHLLLAKTPAPEYTTHPLDGVCTLLVSPTPFTPQDLEQFASVTTALRFDPLLTPHATADPFLEAMLTDHAFESFLAAQPIDLSPPTDDRPFFFNVRRLSDVLDPAAWNTGPVFLLTALLGIVSLLTLGCILLPLWMARPAERPLAHWPFLVFFAAIGAGFMSVEVAVMQQLMVFLGHPVYGLTVVLFTFLLSGGLGSLTVPARFEAFRPAAFRLGALGFVLIAVLLGWPRLSTALVAASTPVRLGVTVALLIPLGFFMGMPFPLGMALAGPTAGSLAPWFWGMNGATSIVASVLAMILAFGFGISRALWFGLGCYVIAGLALFLAWRQITDRPVA